MEQFEQIKNKHYIRLDTENRITKGFSTAFEQPIETDILINEDGNRHFMLNGEYNPSLQNMMGIPIYKWSGTEVLERTAEEIQADIDAIPPPPLTTDEIQTIQNVDYDFRLTMIEMGLV